MSAASTPVGTSGPRRIQTVVEGLGFGESPRWHDGRLWYSDFVAGHVASLAPGEQPRIELRLPDRPSGLGWLPDGRLLVVSMRRRLLLRREHDGQVVTHADLSSVATSDANDMVVAADGTAYVGNFGSDLLVGEPHRSAALAMVSPDGTVSVAAEGLAFPNGSVITPDGRVLIVGESLGHRYTAFALSATGVAGPGRLWADLGDRSPDGCTLDQAGAIWFADASGREVVRVAAGGQVLETVTFPDTPYACALGGPDGRSLYVLTSPSVPMPELETGGGRLWVLDVDHPHAGRP